MGVRVISEKEKNAFMAELREANKDVNRRDELTDKLYD